MNFKVLVFLALLVGGLVYLLDRQHEAESQVVVAYNGPLLEGVLAERIVEIRWDHVQDNRQVALERTLKGWMIVDPIEFPAAPHRVGLLLDALSRQAREVPEPDKEAVASHFDPPRIAVTLFEEMEGGARREHRFQIGALDADGMQVEVEKDGRYMRTLRNLNEAFTVNVNDLRKRRIFELNPDRLILIERSGFSDASGAMLDLQFKAGREGPTWQQYLPEAVQLDAAVMTVWTRQLCSMYADGFASDLDEPDLAKFGLHMPNARLKLSDASGKTQELLFAETSGGAWYAKLSDNKTVYSMRSEQLLLVLDDWTLLRDTRLVRAHRADISQIELTRPSGMLRLSQGLALDDDWTVATKPTGQSDYGVEWLAEMSTVQEFLGLVEQSEVTNWLPTATHESKTLFAKGVAFTRLKFIFRNMLKGETSTALVGPIHTTESGTKLRTYNRQGDEPVGLVPLAIHDWVTKPMHAWRSRLMWDLKESRLARLRLTQGASVREYKRKIQGTWTYMDAETSPVELLPALDHLVFLRAEEHLEGEEFAPLQDPVKVEFLEVGGTQHQAEIGLTPDGQVQIQIDGHRSVARNQKLHALLSGILSR
ncbi:MAG: DUF4340 domain-containing protein [Planctomycetes bacterium]|nr:DUF4340 domain-containing protein [Planctomycetota bacterium]